MKQSSQGNNKNWSGGGKPTWKTQSTSNQVLPKADKHEPRKYVVTERGYWVRADA